MALLGSDAYAWKAISVAKLRELLTGLQDADTLSASNDARNLSVYRDEEFIGAIDIAREELWFSRAMRKRRRGPRSPSVNRGER